MTAATIEGPGSVKRLFATISLNVLASILTALAGVGATALMARKLPVDEFGRILLLLTAVNAFAIFEGLRPVIVHRVATGADSPQALFRSAGKVNALMVVATLTCLAAMLLAGAGSSLPALAELALAATVIVFFVAMQYWMFLDAEQDTMFTGCSRAFCWVILYISFAVLAEFRLDIFYFTLALLAMYALLAVLLMSRFRIRGFAEKYGKGGHGESCSDLVQPAISNIVFNICAVTINVADRAIVGAIMGARPAGLYAGPSELTLRAVGLVRAGVQVILPWAARLSDRHQQRYWSITTAATLIAVGGSCAILLLIRDAVAVFLLGPAFRDTGDLLGLFSVGIIVSTLGYACIIQFNARGDFGTQRRLYMVAATILLAGAAWGAFAGSLMQVATAYLAARCVDLLLLAILLKRSPRDVRWWFGALGAAIVFALATGWIQQVWWTIAFLGIACGIGYGFWRTSLRQEP